MDADGVHSLQAIWEVWQSGVQISYRLQVVFCFRTTQFTVWKLADWFHHQPD